MWSICCSTLYLWPEPWTLPVKEYFCQTAVQDYCKLLLPVWAAHLRRTRGIQGDVKTLQLDEAADIANCFLLSRCLRNRPKCYIYFLVLSSSPVLFPFQTFCLALNFFLLHRWFPTTRVILMKKQVHRQYSKCVLKQKSKTCLWNFHKSEIGSLDRKAQIFKK